jgi:hypothetical protein
MSPLYSGWPPGSGISGSPGVYKSATLTAEAIGSLRRNKGTARRNFEAYPTLGPSAQLEWEISVALGVIAGSADEPLMVHFTTAQPVTDHLLELSAPVTPTEVFRHSPR